MYMNERCVGDELKVRVALPKINGTAATDYKWQLHFSVFPNPPKVIKREECIELDDGSFVTRFDSSELGVGLVKLRVVVEVPDGDYPDKMRTESDVLNLMRLVRSYGTPPIDEVVTSPRLGVEASMVKEAYMAWEAYVDSNGRVYKTRSGLIYKVEK